MSISLSPHDLLPPICSKADHPNIVKLLGNINLKDGKWVIPLEFIFGEDLETTIFKASKSKIQVKFSWQQRKKGTRFKVKLILKSHLLFTTQCLNCMTKTNLNVSLRLVTEIQTMCCSSSRRCSCTCLANFTLHLVNFWRAIKLIQAWRKKKGVQMNMRKFEYHADDSSCQSS